MLCKYTFVFQLTSLFFEMCIVQNDHIYSFLNVNNLIIGALLYQVRYHIYQNCSMKAV